MDAKDLTIQQAADQLGVHYMTAYRYVRLGMVPGHKAGSTWHIDAADLHRFRAQGPPVLQEGLRRGQRCDSSQAPLGAAPPGAVG